MASLEKVLNYKKIKNKNMYFSWEEMKIMLTLNF